MNIRLKKIIFFYKKATDEELMSGVSSNLLKEKTKEIQILLDNAGYRLPFFGSDGVLGPETYKALLKFKKDNNLPLIKDLTEDEFLILKEKSKDNISSEVSSGDTLLFGDSQMQGGIGQALEEKYGGKRISKAGSSASYWVNNSELISELKKMPKKIIIQLNSNGVNGTKELLEKIKNITPSSKIVWYGAPPAILKPNSIYKQVTTPESLSGFNQNRKSMNSSVAGMLASSGLKAEFIDPFTSIFDSSRGQAYNCTNCDGVHVPLNIAQQLYA